jgi:hypothetical protein
MTSMDGVQAARIAPTILLPADRLTERNRPSVVAEDRLLGHSDCDNSEAGRDLACTHHS